MGTFREGCEAYPVKPIEKRQFLYEIERLRLRHVRILVVEDGAQSLLNMRKSGAHTIAQNEASCVVFGMPKEAIAAGGAEKVVPLSKIALTMIQCASR